ncbi:MAG: DUF389 domain-containing protein [Vicinamibacteria bacterium]|nr:DUF389 domain-containing protein [Vicinamibacteria bacterium]
MANSVLVDDLEVDPAASAPAPPADGADARKPQFVTPADRIDAFQDGLLRGIGSSPDRRAALLSRMIRRDASESIGYWLQLTVSVGIGTLGLVTGSSAVIIGAMLIAPLMDPIIALALGLAIGSPLLSLRALIRIVLSVGVAVAGSAVITVLLPFHEINAEIAARVSPTLLDLITAVFCALAGLYACIRGTSDVVTAGAGTAIGISLVPPLCVAGYGIGAGAWPVASGAGLLFLANIVAIITVGGAVFLALGFNRVDPSATERAELLGEASAVVRALASRFGAVFDRPDAHLLRFLMPLALFGIVFIPLKAALDEVAWEVTVRRGVREIVEKETRLVLQTKTRVERRQVDVTLVLLGTSEDAEKTRRRLDSQIRQFSGVIPRLSVSAVTDARGVNLAPAAIAPPTPPGEIVEEAQELVTAGLALVWPEESSGPLVAVDVGRRGAGIQVRLLHLGPPLDQAAREAIERSLAGTLTLSIAAQDVAIPTQPIKGLESDERALATALSALESTEGLPGVNVCYTSPKARPRTVRARDAASALDEALVRQASVSRSVGVGYQIRFSAYPCSLGPAEKREP